MLESTATGGNATLRLPLEGEPALSANFGELRPNHFHSGLDFKTGGETGRRVMAVADGYVSGVEVSPWGYGRAVYVTHPQLGLVTVYGHLKSFAPAIDRVVWEAQYAGETFDIELAWGPEQFPVKAGDVIGLSGNAGSSGGPHLHFNVEDLATGDPMDPLPFFKRHFTDTKAPYYNALYLYPDAPRGIVNGSYKPAAQGRDDEKVFTAWGRVIPAIKCNDEMDGSSNIFGVKTLVLFVDGKPVMGRVIDRFPYRATRAINTLVDYTRLVDGGGWAEWSRIPAARPLSMLMGATPSDGVININAERDYHCKYVLQDEFGNQKIVNFTIRGKRPSRMPRYDRRGSLLRPGGYNSLHCLGGVVEIGRDALWDDTEVAFSSVKPSSRRFLSDIFLLQTGMKPFAKDVRLTIAIPSSIKNRDKLCIVSLKGESATGIGGKVTGDVIAAQVSQPGRYAVMVDDTNPTIEVISPERQSEGYLAWRVKDTISGLAGYRVEIDGKYALAELDGKNNLVEFKMDPTRFKTGSTHRAVITATDGVGNRSTLTSTFSW